MKNYKRILAILLTGVMVAGSTVTAFAEDGEGATPDPNPSSGTIESEGEIEAIVDTDVFGGVFPTTETGDGLKFFMDPQGLLTVADEDTYAGGAGAVYFIGNEDDNTQSADLTFKNKSSYDVTAKLSVTVAAEGIDLVEAGALEEATKPSLALLITDGDDETDDTAITAEKAVVEKDLDAIAYKFDSKKVATAGYIPGKSGKYYYAYIIDDSKLVDSDVPADAQVTYNIKGTCSIGGDWSKVKDNKATAKVVWDVKKAGAADAIEFESGKAFSVDVDTTKGMIKSITFDGAVLPTARYSYVANTPADGKMRITFDSTFATNHYTSIGQGNTLTYTVTFGDDSTVSFDLKAK